KPKINMPTTLPSPLEPIESPLKNEVYPIKACSIEGKSAADARNTAIITTCAIVPNRKFLSLRSRKFTSGSSLFSCVIKNRIPKTQEKNVIQQLHAAPNQSASFPLSSTICKNTSHRHKNTI